MESILGVELKKQKCIEILGCMNYFFSSLTSFCLEKYFAFFSLGILLSLFISGNFVSGDKQPLHTS